MPEPRTQVLLPCATRDEDHGGREHAEPADPLRTPFELDRHRIIESAAFRRLEGKTQVFTATAYDHFRTRMTHTLEVAQIARCLARNLGANETLAEVIALAHDLGHPPFGHAGEAALNELMRNHRGFNHNVHSLRVVKYLEHPVPRYRGLNLTKATREGLAVHATKYDAPADDAGQSRGSVEAQIASIADRIAYNCHDLEDAIGANFVDADSLAEIHLWRHAYDRAVADESPHLFAVRRPVLDGMLHELLTDIIDTSRPVLVGVSSPSATSSNDGDAIRFSHETENRFSALEHFLAERVYRHPEIAAADADGRAMIDGLFVAFAADPARLPARFTSRIEDQGTHRVVCDYVAGMTDRFCREQYDSVP